IDSKEQRNFLNLNDLFTTGNEILSTFEIKTLSNQPKLSDTVKQIAKTVNEDDGELAELIEERFRETHLAIPETNIALFH
ncbi:transcription antiterminator, partial [Xanthomonas citri pv. citri]|nr:transcription antiterminator [Xanthomonas citri pv. citri]